MKKIISKLANDGVFITGVSMIILSFLLFLLPDLLVSRSGPDMSFAIFVANYLISIIYFIVVWRTKIGRLFSDDILASVEYGFLHLILCLISAYSLNREIPIFEKSVPWLQVFLFVQSVVMILMFFKDMFPLWLKYLMFFLMGSGFAVFLYLSLYLIPVYPAGIIGFFYFGRFTSCICPGLDHNHLHYISVSK